jgi:hypothetical protein
VGDPARDQVELADGLFGPLTEGALVATAATRARMPISVPVWCHQGTEKGEVLIPRCGVERRFRRLGRQRPVRVLR